MQSGEEGVRGLTCVGSCESNENVEKVAKIEEM